MLPQLLVFEAHAKLVLHKYCSRERTLLTVFYEIYV